MTPVSMKHTEDGHPRGHKVSQGVPGQKRKRKYDCLVGTSAGLVLLYSDENVLELSNCYSARILTTLKTMEIYAPRLLYGEILCQFYLKKCSYK